MDPTPGRWGPFWTPITPEAGSLLQAVQHLDLVRDHGRLTIGDAERLSGQNRNTLKQHFRALVADGHLSLNGAGRGAWYSLR